MSGGNVPQISVILPVYNGVATVAGAVSSILGQTFSDFELLVIDDGSTDSTPEILKRMAQSDPRIRVLRNERNLGLTRTLNRGIQESRGAWVVRQDADDVSLPGRLADCMKLARPGCFLVSRWLIDNGVTVREPLSSRLFSVLPDRLVLGLSRFLNFFAHGSFFFDRQRVMELGSYDERFLLSQDFDLVRRVGTRMDFRIVRKPDYVYRSLGGIGSRKREQQVAYALAACVGPADGDPLNFASFSVRNKLLGSIFLLANAKRYGAVVFGVFKRLWFPAIG